MPAFIPAVEVIFRELAKPKATDAKPALGNGGPTKIELTRADVDGIIQRKRSASAAELEQIISNPKAYELTPFERNQLSLDLTMRIAHARQSNGRRENPSDQFIAQVLGLLETPFGLIEREWIDGLLRDGARNIARCKRHQPPGCQCWSAQRAMLWQAESRHGERSPEGWAAARILASLEELELASRLEREPAEVRSA